MRNDDRAQIGFILAGLATWPPGKLRQFMAVFNFWRKLTPGQQAAFALSIDPSLKEADLAELCDRSPRTVYRFEEFRRIKGLDQAWKPAKKRISFRDSVHQARQEKRSDELPDSG